MELSHVTKRDLNGCQQIRIQRRVALDDGKAFFMRLLVAMDAENQGLGFKLQPSTGGAGTGAGKSQGRLFTCHQIFSLKTFISLLAFGRISLEGAGDVWGGPVIRAWGQGEAVGLR